ncbi:hypothetical protein [Streptococcus ruminantium]|uniref:hypothetical protein n=1 Tax=Streptococcus ruminantium TaxID=1917441 RepID=UPI0012DC2450|nr:hypothetical protein [Streptococcus ruminantium]
MIEKPKGRINELVYLNTTYYQSKYRLYPTLTELFRLLQEIIKTNEVTSSIHITPFYMNEKLSLQEEFDIARFYVESSDCVSLTERKEFAPKNMFWLSPESEYRILEKYITLDDMERTHFLLEKTDVLGFQNSLQTYMQFLMDRGVPQMMKWLYDMCDLDSASVPYGYFCFEIRSK